MREQGQDRTVLISGASHGLGLAIARHFASSGARLICLARDETRLETATSDLVERGASVLRIACDISDSDQVASALEVAGGFTDRLDLLINNAGIPAPRTLPETGIEDWNRVVGTNLSGAFYLTRSFWPLLTASASPYVITISGTAGLRGGASPAYGAAKFGLAGLSSAIAAAGKEHGLRSTILYPGSMDTGWRGAPVGEKPLTETMDPAEVARFIAYLVDTPPQFVLNEAVLNPSGSIWS